MAPIAPPATAPIGPAMTAPAATPAAVPAVCVGEAHAASGATARTRTARRRIDISSTCPLRTMPTNAGAGLRFRRAAGRRPVVPTADCPVPEGLLAYPGRP